MFSVAIYVCIFLSFLAIFYLGYSCFSFLFLHFALNFKKVVVACESLGKITFCCIELALHMGVFYFLNFKVWLDFIHLI